MEQKFIVTKSEPEVNLLLSEGWRIVSITPQYVGGNGYGVYGEFAIVLERHKINVEE